MRRETWRIVGEKMVDRCWFGTEHEGRLDPDQHQRPDRGAAQRSPRRFLVALAATVEALSNLVPHRVPAGEGRTHSVLGDRVSVKATAVETGGAYSLFEGQIRPGSGVPPHIERHEDEAFFVLEGTFGFLIGGESVEVGPGGFAFVPRGTPHAFTNVGPETGRLLVLLSPGGIHE